MRGSISNQQPSTVSGEAHLRHPVACQALVDAAAEAGADVVRGVDGVQIVAGDSPTVSYRFDGRAESVTASLVVGADGRASTVRRQMGITLQRQDPINYIAGFHLRVTRGQLLQPTCPPAHHPCWTAFKH
jgi:2-polyprenyl-6-methoxyphenol hydroxylase-like FAD-dependent oxidoreductase